MRYSTEFIQIYNRLHSTIGCCCRNDCKNIHSNQERRQCAKDKIIPYFHHVPMVDSEVFFINIFTFLLAEVYMIYICKVSTDTTLKYAFQSNIDIDMLNDRFAT